MERPVWAVRSAGFEIERSGWVPGAEIRGPALVPSRR